MTEEEFSKTYIQPAVEELARKAVFQEILTDEEAAVFMACGVTCIGDLHLSKVSSNPIPA